MRELKELVSLLSKESKELLLNSYKFKGSGSTTKKYQLLQILLQSGKKSEKEVCICLYGTDKSSAFSVLKNRLQSDVVRVLVSNYDVRNIESPFLRAAFEARQKFFIGDLLVIIGRKELGESYLRKSIKISERYSLMQELILAESSLKNYLGLRKSYSAYSKYSVLVNLHLKQFMNESEAKDLYKRLVTPSLYKIVDKSEFLKYAKDLNEKIVQLNDDGSSDLIKSLVFRSQIFYNHLIRDYDTALIHAKDYLNLVEQKVSLHSKTNKAGANMTLANLFLLKYEYSHVISSCNVAIRNFKRGSMNQLRALSLLFRAQIYSKEYDKAGLTVENASKMPQARKSEFQKALWLYYNANLKFHLKLYDESLMLLQERSLLEHDKEGWRIGIKILEIMNFIELGEWDLAQYRIDSFRKLLGVIKRRSLKREHAIFNFLKLLVKYNYDSKMLYDDPRMEVLLNDLICQYEWDPLGFEIIRFDDWILNKKLALKV